MALTVEDGTGKADSESFVSVSDADTYHSNRGNTDWASLATAAKEQALRKATDYMEQLYRLMWKGYRHTEAQALSWPRDEVERVDYAFLNQSSFYDNDVVPNEVKNACAELALRASADDLAPDLTQGVKREKVDVLEVEYDTNSPQYTRYRAIDNMLAPLLKGTGGAFRKVMRA
jgi:hypothetical protein